MIQQWVLKVRQEIRWATEQVKCNQCGKEAQGSQHALSPSPAQLRHSPSSESSLSATLPLYSSDLSTVHWNSLWGIQYRIFYSILRNFVGRLLRSQCCSPTILLDETEIEEVYWTKFLGIHLDRGRRLSKHCPNQVLMTAYYEIIYPHLYHGVTLWGDCSNSHFTRIFNLQKWAVRTFARQSCWPALNSLKLLATLPLYFGNVSFFKSKRAVIHGQIWAKR